MGDRMTSLAPNLTALIGQQVGARLISHAGSLTGLAKAPASTVQILGAEKALFRALRTRTNTPKYGLIYNSSFIGRAATKNKGRISRFLANKASMAARIDCFSDAPTDGYGTAFKVQVEERLHYLSTGEVPRRNLDVVAEVSAELPRSAPSPKPPAAADKEERRKKSKRDSKDRKDKKDRKKDKSKKDKKRKRAHDAGQQKREKKRKRSKQEDA
jgi:nucleolar protein 56